jgi:hypothetical protein
MKNEDAASFSYNKTYSILDGRQLARRWTNPPGVCEAAPTACAVVICFASFIGSSNVLEFEHHRGVCSVSGEVMLSQKRRNLYLPDYGAAFAFSQFR